MMKLNVMSYYLLIFATIMLYSPITFAPWSYELLPVPPEDGQPRTCPGWISYHGFTLDDTAANIEMAQTREHIFDKDAHKWAAIYAYVIDEVEPTNTPTPETFCSNIFDATVTILSPYIPLRSFGLSCRGWIIMYRFSFSNVSFNVKYAKSRSPGKKYGISIWADSYSSYLETYGETHGVTPTEFCSKLGKYMEGHPISGEELRIMPFMSEYDTSLTCQEWIELYEFNDDLEYNYQKAMKLFWEQSNNHVSIQYWPSLYSTFLRKTYESADIEDEDKTPNGFCTRILGNDDESAIYNFHYDPDDPEPFD